MIRSALAQAVPAVATASAMLYYMPRKGWKWAVPAGLAVHFASSWAVNKLLGALEGLVMLPPQSVKVSNGQVEVPPSLENPAQFHGVHSTPSEPAPSASRTTEVIDQANNVIKLPTAMGEP
jgi:hypothetical protein